MLNAQTCDLVVAAVQFEAEEEEPYLRVKCMYEHYMTYVRSLADLFLYPCTPPTAPVSRSFGLRSSYEIAILDTDLKTHLRALSEPYTTKPPLPGLEL